MGRKRCSIHDSSHGNPKMRQDKKHLKFMAVERKKKNPSGKQEIMVRAGTGLLLCLPGDGGHEGSQVCLDQRMDMRCP